MLAPTRRFSSVRVARNAAALTVRLSTMQRAQQPPQQRTSQGRTEEAESRSLFARLAAAVAVGSVVTGVFAHEHLNRNKADLLLCESATAVQSVVTDHYNFILIGAGEASRSALDTLQSHRKASGVSSKILLVGTSETLTSNEHVKSDGDAGTTVVLGQMATKLDVRAKTVQLDDGRVCSYDKVLIGTGGARPLGLPHVTQDAKPRVVEHIGSQNLTKLATLICGNEKIRQVMVIGGGWAGTETALRIFRDSKRWARPVKVTQVYAEPGVLYQALPEYFRAYMTARLDALGIPQRNYTLATHVEVNAETKDLVVEVDSWDKGFIATDVVISAPTTMIADTGVAADAGLEIDPRNGGIVVNRELMAASDVYAAGDAISYPSVVLGRRRDQSHDHAVASGVVAAHNMLGGDDNLVMISRKLTHYWCLERRQYSHIPSHSLALPDLNLSLDSVGIIDSRLETIGYWEGPKWQPDNAEQDGTVDRLDRGIVFYLNNGVVVGLMLVNVPASAMLASLDPMTAARTILNQQVDTTDVDDVEAALRDLFPCKPFDRTIVKHTNHHAVIPDIVHGLPTSSFLRKNVFKLRRSLTADAARLPQDILEQASSPRRS